MDVLLAVKHMLFTSCLASSLQFCNQLASNTIQDAVCKATSTTCILLSVSSVEHCSLHCFNLVFFSVCIANTGTSRSLPLHWQRVKDVQQTSTTTCTSAKACHCTATWQHTCSVLSSLSLTAPWGKVLLGAKSCKVAMLVLHLRAHTSCQLYLTTTADSGCSDKKVD